MTSSRIVQCLGGRSAEVARGAVEQEIVTEVLEEALMAFVHMGLVPKSAVQAVRERMGSQVEVQPGRAKLVVEEASKVVMVAVKAQNAASQVLERICLVAEHWMAAHYTAKVLVVLVVALHAVQLVVRRLMVGEHRRSMQMTQVDLEAVMAEAAQYFLVTRHGEEGQLLVVVEELEGSLSAQHRREEPWAVVKNLEATPLIADQRNV